jgi:hypothetical protein
MKPVETQEHQPTEADEAAWREAEEDLLAQARQLSREIIERVRTVVGNLPPPNPSGDWSCLESGNPLPTTN